MARSACALKGGCVTKVPDEYNTLTQLSQCVIITLPLDGASKPCPAEPRGPPSGGLCHSMLIFYVDESGDTNLHHEPLLEGETPIFCLSAVALTASDWRAYDRDFWNLKRRYYRRELEQFSRATGRRAEQYEIKGSNLVQPSHARNRRAHIFIDRVLTLCQTHNARCFASIWRKDANNPTPPQSIYTRSLQALAERFHLYCEEAGDLGIVIVDSRTHGLDLQVATSHLSYVFGHAAGRGLTRLVEAPMFADSCLSAGLQIADIVGACLYGNYYQWRCSAVTGYSNGVRLATREELQTGGTFPIRNPARDYAHCQRYWPRLDGLQWRRTSASGVLPLVNVGYRELT